MKEYVQAVTVRTGVAGTALEVRTGEGRAMVNLSNVVAIDEEADGTAVVITVDRAKIPLRLSYEAVCRALYSEDGWRGAVEA